MHSPFSRGALCGEGGSDGVFGSRGAWNPISGYVYCFLRAKANYLGGDIISGLTAVGIQKKEKVNVFFDVGTNGELVVGNREFLVCGAGAAGPALEGEVVKTGMRAVDGAVDAVSMEDGGDPPSYHRGKAADWNLRFRDRGSGG